MKTEIIESFIKKIVSLDLDEKTTEELLFDFYKIVASHYDNKIPESIYNIFITNFVPFKSYVDNIMTLFKISQIKMNKEISDILEEIEEMEEKLLKLKCERINIRKNRVQIVSKIKCIHSGAHTFNGYISGPVFEEELVEERTLNLYAIKKQIDILINESKDTDELEKDLINLFLAQVKEDHEKQAILGRIERFVLEDLYITFISKYKPFEKIFKELNQIADEVQDLINELKTEISNNRQILDGILKESKWTEEQIIEVIKRR